MTRSYPIRVLVVDDSAYMRKVVSEMLRVDPQLQVVGTAVHGLDALEKVEELHPDVVTLDLLMPELDGIGFLRKQMERRRLPVVVVSIASENGTMVIQAMEAGALDFVQKPTAMATEKIFEIQRDLINKVHIAASVRMEKLPGPFDSALRPPARPAIARTKVDAIVFGISTGGPQALAKILPQLPHDFPVPIAIVLHMPVGYTALFASRLNELSALEVIEALGGDEMRPGRVILAQAGMHLKFERQPDGRVRTRLDAYPLDTPHRPSVDVMFQSAAEIYSSRLLGVVMTGMGNDGLSGSAWIKAQSGRIFAEAEESCVVFGMPRSVIEAGLADEIVPLSEIVNLVMDSV